MLNIDLMEIEDRSSVSEQVFTSQMFESLPEDELELLKAYYGADKGERRDVAKKCNLTLAQLYKKLHMIRDKLRKYYKN